MIPAAPAAMTDLYRMSDEAWADLPEDELGELVDGALVEEEESDWTHETAVAPPQTE